MMPPSLDRIDHVHVYVKDRAAAARWYAEVMGMKPIEEFLTWAEGDGPLTLANAANTVRIALFEHPARARHATVALGVGAREFVAWKAHLAHAFGAPVELEDHDLSWSLYFSDPDGNPYEITTYEYREAAALLRSPAG